MDLFFFSFTITPTSVMITRYCEDPFQRVRDFLNPLSLLQSSNSVRGYLPNCSFWTGHCAPCTDTQIPSLSNPENSVQHYCFSTYLHHKLNLYALFLSLLPVPTGGSSSTLLSQMPRMLQILLTNTCMIFIHRWKQGWEESLPGACWSLCLQQEIRH